MGESELTRIMKCKPEGLRNRGLPKLRRMNGIDKDLGNLE
jgi:hypothetical protein